MTIKVLQTTVSHVDLIPRCGADMVVFDRGDLGQISTFGEALMPRQRLRVYVWSLVHRKQLTERGIHGKKNGVYELTGLDVISDALEDEISFVTPSQE